MKRNASALLTAMMLAISLAGCALSIRVETLSSQPIPTTAQTFLNRDLSILVDYAVKNYYKKIDSDECTAQIIKSGIEACLGKFSAYYTPKEYEALNKPPSKTDKVGTSFEGIFVNNAILALFVFPGSHADKAGLKKNDLVIGIKENGGEIRFVGLLLVEVLNALIGPADTSYTLIVLRGKETIELTGKRELVKNWLVYPRGTLYPGQIGYLRIRSWDEGAAAQLKQMETLLLSSGAKKLVYDIRDNPGGNNFEILQTIARHEADEDVALLTIRGVNMSDNKFTKASLRKIGWVKDEPDLIELPCVVLINRNSASASEVFAAFLKHKGCHLVGEPTYKKGTTQKIVRLDNGAGLKLTFGEYLVGPNIVVEGVGVMPNTYITNPIGWNPRDEFNDVQLKKAIEILNNLNTLSHHGASP